MKYWWLDWAIPVAFPLAVGVVTYFIVAEVRGEQRQRRLEHQHTCTCVEASP